MEQLMIGCELKDDFTVKSVITTDVPKDDDMYDKSRPYVTHGTAVRESDGATVTFIFQHGIHHALSPHIAGAQKADELRIGFYLRKEDPDNKIISLSDVRAGRA